MYSNNKFSIYVWYIYVFLQGLHFCNYCRESPHDIDVCMYLHTQRKIVAEYVVFGMLARLKKYIAKLEKYRQILCDMAAIEKKLYGFIGVSNQSSVKWRKLLNEDTSDSSVDAESCSSDVATGGGVSNVSFQSKKLSHGGIETTPL